MELQPETLAEVGFQAGVVELGGGDHHPMQRLAVQGQPTLGTVGVNMGDLVGNRHVRVQIGVPGTRVAVSERGTDQPGGVDLGDAVMAGARERRTLFKKGQGVGHRGVVGLLNRLGDFQGRDRPQSRDGFDRRERHVIARDSRCGGAGVAGDVAGKLTVIGRRTPVLFGEAFTGHHRADRRPHVRFDRCRPMISGIGVVLAVSHRQGLLELRFAAADRERCAQSGGADRCAFVGAASQLVVGDVNGVGVQAFPEQCGHLRFADR